MKKSLLLVMIILLLGTSACSGNGDRVTSTTPATISDTIPEADNTYHYLVDNPYYLSGSNAGNYVAETEDGFYFLVSDTLLYADRDTMEPIPVCAKPNCRHHQETDPLKKQDCDAYFRESQSAGGVFYTDGSLYVFHSSLGMVVNNEEKDSPDSFALTQVSADGTQRKTVLDISCKFPGKNCIHRGQFYLVTQTTNEHGLSVAELWAYSLETPNKAPQLLYQTEERMRTANLVSSLCAYGNNLYLREYVDDEANGKIQVVRIYNLTTEKWTVIENPDGYTAIQNCISNGKLLTLYGKIGATTFYNAGESKPDLAAPMIASALDGSNSKEIKSASWGAATADDKYIYLNSPKLNEVQANGDSVSSTPTDSIYFYDAKMNLIDELPFECLGKKEGVLLQCNIYPMRGETFLLHARFGSTLAFYYFDRSEIGTGNITPVEFLSCEWNTYQFINN